MIFLHQASERTIQSLVRPHWLILLPLRLEPKTDNGAFGQFAARAFSVLQYLNPTCRVSYNKTRTPRIQFTKILGAFAVGRSGPWLIHMCPRSGKYRNVIIEYRWAGMASLKC
jgi:hypothetical protein